MPTFSKKYPIEFDKAGSPSWYLEGFNTSTFWIYLGRNEYKNAIDDRDIIKFLDRIKIFYLVDVILIIGFMFLIEMGQNS